MPGDNSDRTQVTARIFIAAIAGIALIVVIAIRIRLLGVPLERDEGEYAYIGQLMLQGIPPYQLAYSMKFPGTAGAYAIIMSLFGQTITGIHLGLLLVNVTTVVLIFFWAGACATRPQDSPPPQPTRFFLRIRPCWV